MLVDAVTQKHPTMAGPMLIHQRKIFHHLITLQTLWKQLQHIKAGDQALIEALSHNFSEARQLQCFIHLKQNIASKPSSICQEFLSDIFW